MKRIKERVLRQPPTGGRKDRRNQEEIISPKPAPISVAPAKEEQAILTTRMLSGLLILGLGAWVYWPTITAIVNAWNREPDYSHGYLVVPMAALFLWLRRESFPGITNSGWYVGCLLVAVSAGMRILAGTYFLETVDAWSMLLWLAGCVAIVFGWPVLLWSASSIGFLIFMIPLPYRVEGLLSLPLQRIATKASCMGMQLLGLPAIAEGNTILLEEHQLEVAQACSGLRLFFSILALGAAYLMLVRKSWWESALVLAGVVPIAIVANSARIVVTGLLYKFASSEAAQRFSHDFAGLAMIPFAALLFWLLLWYLGKLVHQREQLGVEFLVGRISR